MSKVFLYSEVQLTVPFTEAVWREANAGMKRQPGLLKKTWLSGLNTHTVGGFYEFDSEENARAFATGFLAQEAAARSGSLTVKLFDGDVTEEASRDMNSPHYG